MNGLIRRSFRHLDIPTFLPLYKSLVRTHLDYAASVYSPYRMKHIEAIESVQRRATKQVPMLKNLSYPERLNKLKLPTLAYRRVRGDLIEMFKISHNIYDSKVCTFVHMWKDSTLRSSTRTNNLKIFPQQANSLLRQNSFQLRVARTWNYLPNHIVNAPSLNSFKNRLDKFLNNHDLKYENFKTTLQNRDMSAGRSIFFLDNLQDRDSSPEEP